MPLEIQIHTLSEALTAKNCIIHSNDFCALPIHGGGIEIIHGNITVRTNWMGHGSIILLKLTPSDDEDVLNPLHSRTIIDASRELLIAKYCQSLLERQLEPVAARHAISGPVVKIFVSDDGLHTKVVGIARCHRIGQHARRIKYIQRFVLHRAHVERFHGHDVEEIQIVFESEGVLVPFHGPFEGCEGVVELSDIFVLRIKTK
mmetsp:Transcript_15240/g.32251  ORF Transcript_15240/g.32251 Transcript_15240/m.32251 type:complete len:203 (-) Transcript_15240:921-1529(-)